MTPEAKVKKAFMDQCRKYGIVTFSQILKTSPLNGIIINLELFRIRGIPDKLVLLRGGRSFLLEFKADDGVISDVQQKVMKVIHNLRFPVDVVRGVGDAKFQADILGVHAR